MKNFIQELHRRNVIKAAISYAVISWAMLQASDILFPAFGIPDSAIQYVLYVLIGLFPIWIIFAYVFEWTPTGFKKTNDVAQETSIYQKTGKRLNQFIVGGLILAVVLLVTDRVFNFTGISSPVDQDKSIAVLPFINMSDEDDAYFAAGVTEDILTQISKIGDLRVLSRFTLRDYDTSGKTVQQIGKELGVGYLLMGSIRKIKNELRISCQLVQVNPEEETWAENFDKRMDDIFEIQQQVAIEVAKYLRGALTPEEELGIGKIPTENITAYNIYLKGREAYKRYTKESIPESIELYKKAIELDPSFSLAYAGLADAYVYGTQTDLTIFDENYLDTALINAEKAIALDPKSADAWKSMGFANANKGFDDVAEEMYQKAIELNPNHHAAIHNLAVQKVKKNQLIEAKNLLEKSISLNPLSFHDHNSLGATYFKMDSLDLANKYWRKAYELNPNYIHTLTNLMKLETKRGNHNEVIAIAKKRLNKDSMNWQIHAMIGENYLKLDSLNQAEKHLKKSFSINPSFFPTSYQLTELWSRRGRYDKGMEAAENFLKEDKLSWSGYFLAALSASRLAMYEKSKNLIVKAIEQADEIPTPHLFMAHLNTIKNEKNLAKKNLEKGLSFGQENPASLAIALGISIEVDIELASEYARRLVENQNFDAKNDFFTNIYMAFVLRETEKPDSAKVWLSNCLTILEQEKNQQHVEIYKAYIHAFSKEEKETLDQLKKAMDQGYFYFDSISNNPLFTFLRTKPAFLSILEEMKYKVAKMRSNVEYKTEKVSNKH